MTVYKWFLFSVHYQCVSRKIHHYNESPIVNAFIALFKPFVSKKIYDRVSKIIQNIHGLLVNIKHHVYSLYSVIHHKTDLSFYLWNAVHSMTCQIVHKNSFCVFQKVCYAQGCNYYSASNDLK